MSVALLQIRFLVLESPDWTPQAPLSTSVDTSQTKQGNEDKNVLSTETEKSLKNGW